MGRSDSRSRSWSRSQARRPTSWSGSVARTARCARFQAQLLDAVGRSVVATDLFGVVEYRNRGAEQLFGWTAEEALAEGVETDTQLSALVELGCPTGQGFLWSRPMPAGDAHDWLVEHLAP